MAKITIYTQAYNAGETLQCAIDSVLNQTCGDFTYYVYDNGSTDTTRDIISRYAAEDSRIVAEFIDNNDPNLFLSIAEKLTSGNDYDFFCVHGSDGEYAADFLEKSLAFMKSAQCGVVCCGSGLIDARSNEVIEEHAVPSDVILGPNNFGIDFPKYYPIIRNMRGKLFSRDTLANFDFDGLRRYEIRDGIDALFSLMAAERAKRLGIIAGMYHKRYVSTTAEAVSVSYIPGQFKQHSILFEKGKSLLLSKCGEVSERNDDFLLLVYFRALTDALSGLLSAAISEAEKIKGLDEMFFCEASKTLAAREGLGSSNDNHNAVEERRQLFAQASEWLLSRKEVPDELAEQYCELGIYLCAAAEDSGGWVLFNKLLLQFYMDQKRVNDAKKLATELHDLLPEDEDIIAFVSKYSQRTSGLYRNGCDDEFYALINRIKTDPINKMLASATNSAMKWLHDDHEYYGLLLKWYKSWYGVNSFSNDQGFVNYFGGIYSYFKQNADEIAALYESLADYRSKMSLKVMLQHWLTFHPDLRKQGVEHIFEHYFDLDIIKCDENEVFVDCGCFIGDTVQEFIKQYGGRYKSIYSYELTLSTFQKARQNLQGIPRLHLRNSGVSNKKGQFPMLDNVGGSGSGNRLNPNGNIMARVVRIDDDINENITFIKMDVEGAEIDALKGAEQQIRRNKPKLAISLYHKITDLIDVPKLLRSYVPEYKLYLQHKGGETFPFPTEYVLLAVVKD